MRIAPLAAADAPCYRLLMLEAYELAADAFTSTAEERAAEPEAWWTRRIADPAGHAVGFGAWQDGTLVGTVALEFSTKPKTCHKALLVGMYVKPAARGCGFARQLLDAAIACAEARPGLRVLSLTATEGNAPAIGLYRSAGFVVFGTEPMAILTPSGFQAKVHMWRPLAGPPAFP